MTIQIPGYGEITLRHVVLDYNGTIARDGALLDPLAALLPELSERYRVHVITADTFGSVQAQLEPYDTTVKILTSDDHTAEKAAYIDSLGASHAVAIGNGNNDAAMLQKACIGIALVGDEGCSTRTMHQSDILCKDIADALGLLLHPKRLIATLRR